MTDDSSRECGGEVIHSSSMSNPDPSRAALADELEMYADQYEDEWSTATPTLSWEQLDSIVEALRAAVKPSGERGAALAWHCCDERYPFIKDIVTTSPTTVEAWREGDIKFQPLYALPPRLNSGADREAIVRVIDDWTGKAFDRGFASSWHYGELIDAILAHPRAVEGGAPDIRAALKSLSNEVSGWLSLYETDLRAAMGHTNFAVMQHKLSEAQSALSPNTGDGDTALPRSECLIHPQHQVWELLRRHFPDDKADFIVSIVAPYLARSEGKTPS